MVKDPVCGMEIGPEAAATRRSHMGHTFYFCSTQCADTFNADPHKYAHPVTDMVYVKYDPALIQQEQITTAINQAGFGLTTGFHDDRASVTP
ncbi:MAG: YHS domain-containing protein [Chloroflexi bacterium]|nr:YHS domain-containing protein [Chloroflexota bacterium]